MKVLIFKTVAMKWKGGCIHRVQSYEGMLGGDFGGGERLDLAGRYYFAIFADNWLLWNRNV